MAAKQQPMFRLDYWGYYLKSENPLGIAKKQITQENIMTTIDKRDSIVSPRILRRLDQGTTPSAQVFKDMMGDVDGVSVSRSDVRLAILDLLSEGVIEMAGPDGLRRK